MKAISIAEVLALPVADCTIQFFGFIAFLIHRNICRAISGKRTDGEDNGCDPT
jgi:hypothetical protein